MPSQLALAKETVSKKDSQWICKYLFKFQGIMNKATSAINGALKKANSMRAITGLAKLRNMKKTRVPVGRDAVNLKKMMFLSKAETKMLLTLEEWEQV